MDDYRELRYSEPRDTLTHSSFTSSYLFVVYAHYVNLILSSEPVSVWASVSRGGSERKCAAKFCVFGDVYKQSVWCVEGIDSPVSCKG